MRLGRAQDSVQSKTPVLLTQCAGAATSTLALEAALGPGPPGLLLSWHVARGLSLTILLSLSSTGFLSLGSISAGLLHFDFFPLVMDFHTPLQKTKQFVCLTSPGISGAGVAWEGKHAYCSYGQTFLDISKDSPD